MGETKFIAVKEVLLIEIDRLLSVLVDSNTGGENLSGFHVIECVYIKGKLKELIEGHKVL